MNFIWITMFQARTVLQPVQLTIYLKESIVALHEVREHEGTFQQAGSEEVTSQHVQPAPPAAIDVEAIDDDVIESSARAFAEVCFSCSIIFCFHFNCT